MALPAEHSPPAGNPIGGVIERDRTTSGMAFAETSRYGLGQGPSSQLLGVLLFAATRTTGTRRTTHHAGIVPVPTNRRCWVGG